MFLEPKMTLVCLPLYPLLRFFGRKMGWRQEGAISSLTTMFVIACSVLALRGPGPGIYAFVLFAIVLIRHVPNLKKSSAKNPDSAGDHGDFYRQPAQRFAVDFHKNILARLCRYRFDAIRFHFRMA